MQKLKVGIIGTGNISHFHITSYQKNPAVEVYALCDIDEKCVKQVGYKYGIERIYTDIDDFLAVEALDAVSICTWNSEHAVCAIKALKAGKHVLCEKPMAINATEAKAMKEASEQSGKLLMVGFVRRFGNDCDVIKDFMDAGTFGEIYYTKATYLRRNGNPGGWSSEKERSGGGALIDLGVHVIDLVRYLLGGDQVVSVYGATFKQLYDRYHLKDRRNTTEEDKHSHLCDVEDLASAMIRFKSGAVLCVEASFSLNIKGDEGKIELFGTKGGVKVHPHLEIYTEMNGYMVDVNLNMPTALRFDGLFEREINHFIDVIQGKAECISPAQQGVVLMEILDAIYESSRTGHEIVLE